MLSRIDSAERRYAPAPTAELAQADARAADTANEADLRRKMYERIARGNALAEAEESARRTWRDG